MINLSQFISLKLSIFVNTFFFWPIMLVHSLSAYFLNLKIKDIEEENVNKKGSFKQINALKLIEWSPK